MRFLILGAGGIGSYFGARLINAGHDVIFVARGKHLEALQQKELKLNHPEFCFSKKLSLIQLPRSKRLTFILLMLF